MSIKNKQNSSDNFLVRAEFLNARPPDRQTARPPLVITVPRSLNGWGKDYFLATWTIMVLMDINNMAEVTKRVTSRGRGGGLDPWEGK